MNIIHVEGLPVGITELSNIDLNELQEHYLPIVSDINENDLQEGPVKTSKNRSQKYDTLGTFDKFNQVLTPYVDQYVQWFRFQFPHTVEIDSWYNVHAKYDHQQLHNHIITNVPAFSSVCVLKQPNSDAGQFSFPTPALSNHLKYLELDPDNNYPNVLEPPMHDGVLIFFPSCLNHYVTYNRTDELRIVFASNIIVKRTNL